MKNIWILIFPLLVFSCNKNNDFTTETGVEVSCLVKGDGLGAQKDSIVVLYLKIVGADGEVLTETTPEKPLALAFDPEMKAGNLQEVLKEMEVGDSVFSPPQPKIYLKKLIRHSYLRIWTLLQ